MRAPASGVLTPSKDKQKQIVKKKINTKSSKANVDIKQKTPLKQQEDMCSQTQARFSSSSGLSGRVEISTVHLFF